MSQVRLEHEGPRVSSPPIIPPEERSKSSQPIEAAGQRKAVFPLSEGDVTFLFPEKMTQDGIEELEAYLKVFLKKEKREASKD